MKTFPPKLNWRALVKVRSLPIVLKLFVSKLEPEFPNFSLNLGFENSENETMTDEELEKSVEDQKSINTSRSTQFALRTYLAIMS